MILMICATGIPSAADRSLTVTPEGTVTGPVGGDRLLLLGARFRAVARLAGVLTRARGAGVDHDAALAPATAGAAPAVGRFGLFPPDSFAMAIDCRERRELGIDLDRACACG